MDQNTQPTKSSPKKTTFSAQSADVGEGTLQDRILAKVAELGDLLERAGEKIESKGFEKIGEAIYRLGDRMEHLKDSEFISGKGAGKSTRANGQMGQSVSRTDAEKPSAERPSKDQMI